MLLRAPKGTKDILPEEVYKWQYIENELLKLCEIFEYDEIRIPVFERTELFARGVGDTTDIVNKEMYTFKDKGGRSMTLRPEGTAGIVRSYIEHGMASLPQPVKLFYKITAYRYENVQKGRYREFNQFGVEIFGSDSPLSDVEVISFLDIFIKKIGLKNIKLSINSIGCPECRKEYNKILREYFKPNLKNMCQDCQERYFKNPMRIIDCKEERCKEYVKDAPLILDKVCSSCRLHFDNVKNGLENLGIEYEIDQKIVRGLDYYTRTVFEFISENVGTQKTVCGGGRYDGLIKTVGGKSTPGIGFAMGIERLLMEIESQGIKIPRKDPVLLFVVYTGEAGKKYAQKLVKDLRGNNIKASMDLIERSIKAQMKYANKINAVYTTVIGDDELKANKGSIKNMDTGETREVSLDSIVDRFVKRGGV